MHHISRTGRNRERHSSSRGRSDTLPLQQRHNGRRSYGRTDRQSRGTVYLNKPWYRPCELPAVTGIPRSFWRPYKKAGDVWIWRKLGTHPSAPVVLRRPTREVRHADSKAAVWNPRERARRVIEKVRSQSNGLSTEDRRILAHELLMVHLECEYLMLRLSNLKAAEALLIELRHAVEKLLDDSE